MSRIITKDFHGSNLRIILIESKEFFIAKDVAELLGYSNTNKAVQDHCRKMTNLKIILNDNNPLPLNISDVEIYRKLLGNKWATIQLIPESDIWRLIIKSQMPEAEKVEKWIFEDVLPQIRKTGSYSISQQKTVSELSEYLEFVEPIYS